jgi:predicted Zn-dependent protease
MHPDGSRPHPRSCTRPSPCPPLRPVPLCAAALLLAALAVSFPAAAVVLKSNVPGAHYDANAAARVEINRLRSRLRLGNLEGAGEALGAALAGDSLSGEVWDLAGMYYLREGRDRQAYDAYARAAILAPDQAPIWNRLAQTAILRLGMEQEGLEALRMSLTADSLYAPAWYTKAVYHWTRAELDQAAEALDRARRTETEEERSAIWYSAQLGLRLSLGDYVATATALKVQAFQAPRDVSAWQYLSHAQRGAGRPREALVTVQSLLKMSPNQPVWLVDAGLTYRALGVRDSALVMFALAEAGDSTSFDAGYNRMLELLADGDTALAVTELRRLRGLDRGNYLVPLMASRIARAAGDTARARLAFDEARRLNPALGLAAAGLTGEASSPAWSSPELATAEHLIEQGEFAFAGDRLYQAAQEPVRRAAALYWLSRSTRMGGSTAGLPVVAAQAGAEASNGDPVLVRALAEAQWAAGDTARAIANLQALRKSAPTDLVAAAMLAEALLARGPAAAARAVFNEVALDPTRSWRIESARAAVLGAVNDPGAAIARAREQAADYLAAGT